MCNLTLRKEKINLMCKKRYYAVKQGRKAGIFDSWDTCREQVDGYKKAIYKGFATEREAKLWLGQIKPEVVNYKKDRENGKAYAYVDGSYNTKTGNYGYASVLRYGDEVSYDMGLGQDKSRNISGELLASMAAIRKAVLEGIKELTIYYDYVGIADIATGKQKKVNTAIGKEYQRFLDSIKGQINLNFVHTPSHTGIRGNEEVDNLAKRAARLSTLASSESM